MKTETGETVKVHESVYNMVAKYRWQKIILRREAVWKGSGASSHFMEVRLFTKEGPQGKAWYMRDLISHSLRERGEEPTGTEIRTGAPG